MSLLNHCQTCVMGHFFFLIKISVDHYKFELLEKLNWDQKKTFDRLSGWLAFHPEAPFWFLLVESIAQPSSCFLYLILHGRHLAPSLWVKVTLPFCLWHVHNATQPTKALACKTCIWNTIGKKVNHFSKMNKNYFTEIHLQGKFFFSCCHSERKKFNLLS